MFLKVRLSTSSVVISRFVICCFDTWLHRKHKYSPTTTTINNTFILITIWHFVLLSTVASSKMMFYAHFSLFYFELSFWLFYNIFFNHKKCWWIVRSIAMPTFRTKHELTAHETYGIRDFLCDSCAINDSNQLANITNASISAYENEKRTYASIPCQSTYKNATSLDDASSTISYRTSQFVCDRKYKTNNDVKRHRVVYRISNNTLILHKIVQFSSKVGR